MMTIIAITMLLISILIIATGTAISNFTTLLDVCGIAKMSPESSGV